MPSSLEDFKQALRGIKELRQEICAEAQRISNILPEQEGGNKVIDIYDIHVSIPKTSIPKDLNNAFVVTNDNEIVPLSEIVRLSDWADAFSYHKWNAYIFSRSDIIPIVSIASKTVFERHGLKFGREKIFRGLKEEKLIVAMLKNLIDNYSYTV